MLFPPRTLPGLLLGLLLLAFSLPAAAQSLTYFPDRALVPTLLADPMEPQIMAQKSLGDREIEARLGGNWDLLRFDLSTPTFGVAALTLGATGLANMQLDMVPIGEKPWWGWPFLLDQRYRYDLVSGDYAFGGYLAAEQPFDAVALRYRLQFVHLSAHLGDSFFLDGEGRASRAPLDYSRNYWQFLIDAETPWGLRAYVEPGYLSWYDRDLTPGEPPLSTILFHAGTEYRHRTPFLHIVRPFAAADVRWHDVDDANWALGLKAGLRFGTWDGPGLDVFLHHTSGPDWRGQFFGQTTNEWQAGVRVDV